MFVIDGLNECQSTHKGKSILFILAIPYLAKRPLYIKTQTIHTFSLSLPLSLPLSPPPLPLS